MTLENEEIEIHETYTEVVWHIAFATCDLRAMPKLDLPGFLSVRHLR